MARTHRSASREVSTAEWQPLGEPMRVTLMRTGAIAVALGAMIAGLSGGALRGVGNFHDGRG
jgi:hypothetical protein